MTPTVIYRDSEAWQWLQGALNDPETRKISLDIQPDGIAVKINEYMWSIALDGGETNV